MMLKVDVVQSNIPSHFEITTKELFQSKAFPTARQTMTGGNDCSETAVEAFKDYCRSISRGLAVFGG